MTQVIDHVALLPAYLAAGTTLLALLTDLAVARRAATLGVTAAGAAAVAVTAWLVGTGEVRATFCLSGSERSSAAGDAAGVTAGCSFVADQTSAVVAVLFALLTLGVLGLSAGAVRGLPAGEYCFLLAASMTGGVALAYSRDLITLIVALETLTLPLYALVGLRRRSVDSVQGAITFFVVSVVAIAVTLLGAALLYAATGGVHLGELATALDAGVPAQLRPLATAGVVLVVAGLAFKVAAVPFHAWAPAAYDGAPLPIAAYLSTASKLGGVVAVVYVVQSGLRPWLDVVGPALAAFAVLTMTVGNLVALRQRRMVRLLAWSSVAQAGYILAPLGGFAVAAGRTDDAVAIAVAATIAYAIFYVMIEFAAFGSVVALRGSREDGGAIEQYRGIARRSPLVGAAFTLALIGLAGLPPGLAGMFAKVVVVRSLLAGGAEWLAVVVAVNAVIGLAYYVRVAAHLYATPAAPPPPEPAPAPVAAAAEPASAVTPTPAGSLAAPDSADSPAVPASVGPASTPGSAGTPASSGSGGSQASSGAAGLPGAVPTATAPALTPTAMPDGLPQGGPVPEPAGRAVPWPVTVALGAATLLAIVVGFAPQLVLDAAALVAP